MSEEEALHRRAPGRGDGLFGPEFLALLERLRLLLTGPLAGRRRGEHLTRRRGTGLELVDFRPYQPGDDPRRIDWNVFSRLDQLHSKLHASEEDLRVCVLLDASESMAYGDPSKFVLARRIAAALAVVGLWSFERASVLAFGERVETRLPDVGPRRGVHRLLDFLGALQTRGGTDLGRAFGETLPELARPALVYVISDFLGPVPPFDGLDRLRTLGHEISLVRVLAGEELRPRLRGDLRLVDVESGRSVRLTMDAALARGYRRALERSLRELEGYARRTGIEHVLVDTGEPLETVLLGRLFRLGRRR